MNRVEEAIRQGRCVLAIGQRALGQADVLAELRRRNVPAVSLGGTAVSPAQTLDAQALAHVLEQEGGVIVLVEPEGTQDGGGLSQLGKLIKAASNTPRLQVAARAFNPFALPMAMRLMKMEHVKLRAKDFLSTLPLDVAPVAAPAAAAPVAEAKSARARAPRPIFVGREAEVAQVNEWLGSEGGPIVVVGSPGSGRRWLMEHVLEDSELTRLPDFEFGRGIGADTLLARFAALLKEAGDETLHNAIRARADRMKPVEMAELLATSLQSEAVAGKVMVLRHLDRLLDRRDGSIYREGRLELCIRALLTSTQALRLVFTSTQAPTFYKEGQAEHLRVLSLAGIQGKLLHELFEAWQCPEFPRDQFGPIFERTHGHPVAARSLAIAVRDEDGDVEAVLEQQRFLRSTSVDDLGALTRHLKRKVGNLDPEVRKTLAAVANLPLPASPETLQLLGVSRNDRLALIADGLLEQTPNKQGRLYYVHPLVSTHLTLREIQDFELLEQVGLHLHELTNAALNEGRKVEAVALGFEANRLLVDARRQRARMPLPYPDGDPILETVRGLMRRKNPRLDIARMRVNEGIKYDPANPELYLLDAELRIAEKANNQQISEAFDMAKELGPTPELFHAEASWHVGRQAKGKAMAALQKGTEAFPENGRLQRRLATLLIHQGRLIEARDALKRSLEVEPMMPGAYSQLGEVYTLIGVDHFDLAAQVLDEALQLEPEGANHKSRLASLLHARSMVAEPEAAQALLEQAAEIAREALAIETNHPRTMTVLAGILLDSGGDLEQAQWLTQKALKNAQNVDTYVQRARVLVRQQALDEAGRLLTKAARKDKAAPALNLAQIELEEARGQIFLAFEAAKQGHSHTSPNAPERAVFERKLQQLGALIASGQVAEIMKAAEGSAEESAPVVESDGPRRDAGTTTKLRKRGKDGAPVEAAPAAAPAEAAPAEAAPADAAPAEAAPEEASAEAAPAEAAPAEAAPAEAAPAEAAPEEASTEELAPEVNEQAEATEPPVAADPDEEPTLPGAGSEPDQAG